MCFSIDGSTNDRADIRAVQIMDRSANGWRLSPHVRDPNQVVILGLLEETGPRGPRLVATIMGKLTLDEARHRGLPIYARDEFDPNAVRQDSDAEGEDEGSDDGHPYPPPFPPPQPSAAQLRAGEHLAFITNGATGEPRWDVVGPDGTRRPAVLEDPPTEL